MFKVSVIIPVFNAEKYITRAINSASVLEEVGEVIVIDDGSIDNSYIICKELSKENKKIKLLQHQDKGNHGPAATRNLGILAAEFDYIAFLDSDDYYLPNRFQFDKEVFLKNNNADGVYGILTNIFENEYSEKVYFNNHSEILDYSSITPVEPHKLYRALLFYGYIRFYTPAITIKRNILIREGMFNEHLRWSEDTELWIKLSLKATLLAGNLQTPICIRWVHGNNSVHQTDKAKHYKIKMYHSLLKWSLAENFPFAVVNDIFNAYKSYLFQNFPLKNEKQVFWRLIKSNIDFIFKSFFWRKLKLVYTN